MNMNWQNIVVQIIIPSGIVFIVLKYVFGLILCVIEASRRKLMVEQHVSDLLKIFDQDLATRGMLWSGERHIIYSKYETIEYELKRQLFWLMIQGRNYESEQIIENLKQEIYSQLRMIRERSFYLKLTDSIEKIARIMEHADILKNKKFD